MTSKNLAIIFAPNILINKNKATDYKQIVADMQSAQEVVEFMIEKAEFLFLSKHISYDDYISLNETKMT